MEKDKTGRILHIYTKLIKGEVVRKPELANLYGVNERSIQRDLEDIREFLEEAGHRDGYINKILYDRTQGGYRLEIVESTKLTQGEILAICKILLDSRAFTKSEMQEITEKLVSCCVSQEHQKVIRELVRNEMFHYIELNHKCVFIDKLWEIGNAIRESKYIRIEYAKNGNQNVVTRELKPVAIMFSEFYFYIAAFMEREKAENVNESAQAAYPTIYRIDRIQKLEVTDRHFKIPYRERFEEGEFRKRVQFMYGGKLQKVEFKYGGNSIEAVLDRLPTARIIREEEGIYTIVAEVFGKGIEMWIRSQGEMIFDVSYK